MSLHLFTCEPGWETVLSGELARVFPGALSRQFAAGWVECRLDGQATECEPSVAFASQCLPGAQALAAPSISKGALAAGGWLIEVLREHEGPWRQHSFCIPTPDGPTSPARVRLIEQGVLDLLRKKQRRLLRSRVEEPTTAWADNEALVQIGFISATACFASVILPTDRRRWRRVVSRFPDGMVQIPADGSAPSRAFAKLAEVQIRLGQAVGPDEHCVDLGSSPGSWAWLALRQGARVTAVDRSPLRDDLMQNPKLHFVRGDAFRYEPESPVDWLLCDVIAYPERSFDLLQTWLARRWCRRFCVTIKFKGQDDYPKLEDLKRQLAASGADFYLRRLTSNKNEVMAYGRAFAAGNKLWYTGL